MAAKLEVHSHSYVRGRYANGGAYEKDGTWTPSTFTHSHEIGSEPHQHTDAGPASYTIDKDEWARTTGLQGGGRKRFTAKPTGPQMDRVELEDWQKTFTIIVGEPVAKCSACGEDHGATGGGMATAARMVLAFGMSASVIESRSPLTGPTQ